MDKRQKAIELMQSLERQGIHCQGCPGTCCTFRANSMQITPAEAETILGHLEQQGADLATWRQRWQDCIQEFRLDRLVGQGGRELRKTYTCPFFSGGPQGCQLPKEIKPVGCLVFNPHSSARTEEGQGVDCAPYFDTHPELEHSSSQRFPLTNAAKLPIPVALFEMAAK